MAIRSGRIFPNGELLPVGTTFSEASDDLIRRPLWEFSPEDRKAIQHERRRRFQMDDEPIGDPEYT